MKKEKYKTFDKFLEDRHASTSTALDDDLYDKFQERICDMEDEEIFDRFQDYLLYVDKESQEYKKLMTFIRDLIK